MLLPAIQYGDWRTVKGRMRKVVTRLKRGEPIVEAMTRDGMLDPADHPAMVVLSSMTLGPVPCFYCAVPWIEAWSVLFDLRTTPTQPTAVEDAAFMALLEHPWGVVGLLASNSKMWLNKERHAPFLQAALGFWDELDAIGARYFVAAYGQRLWTVHNNLHFVLANMGVPHEMLRAPLPPEGPRALLRYARQPN